MPDIAMPSKTRKAIICRQLWMKAVHKVMRPKQKVIRERKILGPTNRTQIVAGSWKTMLLTVKMNMLTEYLLPVRSRSDNILVTEADEMTPESSRFRLHRRPAMLQRRRSTLRRNRFSSVVDSSPFCACSGTSVVLGSLFDGVLVMLLMRGVFSEAESTDCGIV